MSDDTQVVLLVDDEPVNLTLLGELLEPHCRVRIANSGERALRIAAGSPQPDLVLLDLMMPGMDGYTVLRHLKANPVTRDIPVIIVSARDSDADEERGLEMGAVDYIGKPIKPLSVLARVRTQLENRRARDWLKDQNKYLEKEIVRRLRDNEIVQNASLSALAILAETRDTDTGNHIHRTQKYVEVLVHALKLRSEYADELAGEVPSMIVKASPLHDIGKVGIPDDVLRKPGRFTPEEIKVMQRHAEIGGDAIALALQRVQTSFPGAQVYESGPLAYLEIARVIALSHHERWDGGGYPHGLQGTRIPLPARIMAVADVFDALTTARVYKPAYPIDQAIAMVMEQRAQHFDPLIADAFYHARGEIAAIARRLNG